MSALPSTTSRPFDAFVPLILPFLFPVLVPGIIYMLVPVALALIYKKLILVPPQGSVVLDACKVGTIALKKRSWEAAKPSVIVATLKEEDRPKGYLGWDDEFIGEMKTTMRACKVRFKSSRDAWNAVGLTLYSSFI